MSKILPIFPIAILVLAAGCEGPQPRPAPPDWSDCSEMEYECTVDANGYGVQCKVTEKWKAKRNPPTSQPSGAPEQEENAAPQEGPGQGSPQPNIQLGIGQHGSHQKPRVEIPVTLTVYGWNDPNTGDRLIDTEVLEFTLTVPDIWFSGPLECGLPLAYSEPSPTSPGNPVTGVWVRQDADGHYLLTSRANILDTCIFFRDDLGLSTITGRIIPLIWQTLTPDEQAWAQSAGVQVAMEQDISPCPPEGTVTY